MSVLVVQIDLRAAYLSVTECFMQRAAVQTELLALLVNMGEQIVKDFRRVIQRK